MEALEHSVIQVAALGRPFKLGMLYDCTTETLVKDKVLWDRSTLEKQSAVEDIKNASTTIIESDSLETESDVLNLNSTLKLSIVGGLIDNISGSAKYIQERTLTSHQDRVTLNYKYTTKHETLDMSQLGKETFNNPEVIHSVSATHVVQGILYGRQFFFTFDRQSFDSHSATDDEQQFSDSHSATDDEQQFSDSHSATDDEQQFSDSHSATDDEQQFSDSHSATDDEQQFSDSHSATDDEQQFSDSQSDTNVDCQLSDSVLITDDDDPSLTALIEKINNMEHESKMKCTESLNLQCYGDFILPTSPATVSEVLELCKTLPDMPCDKDLPLVVWLYPLCNLDDEAPRLEKKISKELANESQKVLKLLQQHEVNCNDLLKYKACQEFSSLHDEVSRLKTSVNLYKIQIQNELKAIIPKIRGGKVDESELAHVLNEREDSPFKEKELLHWLQQKEAEVKLLNELLLSDIQYLTTTDNLSEVLSNQQYQHVVCFNISRPTKDPYVASLEKYLDKPERNGEQEIGEEYSEKSVIEAGRYFQEFYKANEFIDTTKFVICDEQTHVINSAGNLHLYVNGESIDKDFMPPSNPSKLQVLQTTHNSISLTWEKPCFGYHNVTGYEIQLQGTNDIIKIENIARESETYQICNLLSGNLYECKIRACSKAGHSGFSDSTEQIVLPDPPIMTEPSKCKIKQVAALGREFKIGMLYDWSTDTLLSENVLAHKSDIEQHILSESKKDSKSLTFQPDTIESQLQGLEVSAHLQLSVIAGLVKVAGCSKYLNNKKYFFPKSTILMYKCTKKLETLNMCQVQVEEILRDFNARMVTPAIATHVVVGILYGGQALFMFNKSPFMQFETDLAHALVDKFGEELSAEEKELAKYLNVQFHGDFIPVKDPTTYAEALELYKKVPAMLEDKELPLMVWLYPLGKIDADSSESEKEISTKLMKETQNVMGQLQKHEVNCNHLLKHQACQKSLGLHREISCLKTLIGLYRKRLQNELMVVIPNIRKGKVDESELANLLQECEDSPFKGKEVSFWLQQKEAEVKLLNELLSSDIQYLTTTDSLSEVLSNQQYQHVVCFNISRPNKDPYVASLEKYLDKPERNGEQERGEEYSEKSVLEAGRYFHDFFETNESTNIKFVICDEETNVVISAGYIHLYSHGTSIDQDFEPPSNPSRPNVSNITHDSVTITWEAPKDGQKNITGYEILLEPPNSSTNTEKTDDTCNNFVINNLQPSTKYEFKVRACSIAGFSRFSEATESILTLPVSPPGKPTVSESSAVRAKLEWAKPTTIGANICIKFFRIMAEVDDFWYTYEPVPGSNTSAELNLSPNTTYRFRVIADCENDGKSLPGPPSDQFTIHGKGINMLKTVTYIQPPSTPSKPDVVNVTHECITLNWKKPGSGYIYIKEYEILFRKTGCSAQIQQTGNNNETYKMTKLKPGMKYDFQVRARSVAGMSMFSDVTEPIKTRPTSPPGKPTASKLSVITAKLHWDKPADIGQNVVISKYRVTAHMSNTVETYESVEGTETSTEIEIRPNTKYLFSVIAECSEFGESLPSPFSEEFFVEANGTDILKAEILRHKSELIISGNPSTYHLKTKAIFKHDSHNIRKCEFGTESKGVMEKVIMVVGATGSGKTTLINGMINYILGVRWQDPFRFKLVVETAPGQKASQARSQTSWITSYTIYAKSNFKIDYTLTIIDTPGFGDTAGIMRDKKITEQLRNFFTASGEKGIDHIDAVGFVVQSALPRLTPTQRYIFDSILALFGKDIKENIFMLLTFADGQKPPVLDGLEEAELPFQKYFKFNNSALFAENAGTSSDDCNFDEMFWKMGTKSFDSFLNNCLNTVNSKTLRLTKDVLNERHQIEVDIEGIQADIQKGLNTLEMLKTEVQVVKNHEADINKNKDFTYTVNEEHIVHIDIPPGRHTTTCLTCNRTCHKNCAYADDEDKALCSAMNKDTGYCRICPRFCYWKMHKNVPYLLELERKTVVRTAADLKARFEDAKGKKLSTAQVIKNMLEEIEQIQVNVLACTESVRFSLKRLAEIALKPNPLSTTEYIDILIESERSQARPGWMERVEQLKAVRAQAEYMMKLARKGIKDPFAKYKKILEEATTSGEDTNPRVEEGIKEKLKRILNPFNWKIFHS